jgi:para-nitrobenzyl esterase
MRWLFAFIILLLACGGPPAQGGSPASGDAGAEESTDGSAAPAVDSSLSDSVSVDPLIVEVESGALRGVREGSSIVFRGVPYAASPVGALRWRPPSNVTTWAGAGDATRFGPACPQLDPVTGNPIGDEDCLTLNLWAPATPPPAPLPVMVFLHGGGNAVGSSSMMQHGVAVYDGRYLSERGQAIVVTLNYRLGVLGFLTHSALSAESSQHASGNYGLLDQIAALSWLQRNVARFGGDAGRVMVFGQSGGARDTCLLVASPLARGLMSRALVLSGGCDVMPLGAAEAAGEGLARSAGCGGASDVAGCLRGKRVADLVRTPIVFGSGADPTSFPLQGDTLPDRSFKYPPVDGYVLPDTPLALFAAGRHNPMPVVMSTTADEFTTIYGLDRFPTITSDVDLRAFLRARFGPIFGDTVLLQYPGASYPSPYDAALAALRDAVYVCPTRRALRALRSGQAAPVWRAVYTHTFEADTNRVLRAGHGYDLIGFHNSASFPLAAAEQTLADRIAMVWTELAASGAPGPVGGVAWPVYDAATDPYFAFDEAMSVGHGVNAASCDFWDRGS